MDPLATRLENPLFRYYQVCREGMVAIYTQTHKPSGVQRFEVIRIQARKTHTWPNGQTTPAHEAYPGAKSWGEQGWTFQNMDAAYATFEQLVQAQARLVGEEH